jgi:hypothetical protein
MKSVNMSIQSPHLNLLPDFNREDTRRDAKLVGCWQEGKEETEKGGNEGREPTNDTN